MGLLEFTDMERMKLNTGLTMARDALAWPGPGPGLAWPGLAWPGLARPLIAIIASR